MPELIPPVKRNLLIRGARQLLTLHGASSGPRRGDAIQDLGIIEDGSVLIVDGVIASVGATRRVENLAEARNAEEINAAGHVVMPGFVDCHTTLFGVPGRLAPYRFAESRSFDASATLNERDLAATVNYLRTTNGPALEFQASKHIESFLRHGTTTIEARTGYGLPASGEMKLVRVLSNLDGKCISIVPTYTAGHRMGLDPAAMPGYVEWLVAEVLPRMAERRSVRYLEAECGDCGLSFPEARVFLHAARRLGMWVKVVACGLAEARAVKLALEFEAACVSGVHRPSDDELAALARASIMTTLLPARLPDSHSRGADMARRLIDAGASVALGSGFEPSTCSTLNMQNVIALACMWMRMTPEEAITAATINAAYAIGLGGRIGSLEFSKDADVCILNVSDYREIPLYFGTNLVSAVVRKGVTVYRAGNVVCAGE